MTAVQLAEWEMAAASEPDGQGLSPVKRRYPWGDTPPDPGRGGGWTTRSRLIRTNYRNFYPPDRQDVWAGFRTCALAS